MAGVECLVKSQMQPHFHCIICRVACLFMKVSRRHKMSLNFDIQIAQGKGNGFSSNAYSNCEC